MTTRMVVAAQAVERGIDGLWAEYTQSGRLTLRNELIAFYLPFVREMASRVRAGLPRHVEEDDLVSYGVIGLIDAIERFEPDRSLKFETYAAPRVKGAMIDELRSLDWVPRSVRAKAHAIEHAFGHLEATLRRTPTEAELASELEMSRAELQTALRHVSTIGTVALDETWQAGNRSARSPLVDALADGAGGPMDAWEAKESATALLRAIADLPERERTVLLLYYYDGLKLNEIGAVLGVSESRVCQVHTGALRELRSKLADDLGAAPGRVTVMATPAPVVGAPRRRSGLQLAG